MFTPTSNRAVQATTLGGSASQLTGAGPANRTGVLVGIGLALAVGGAMVGVMARGGNDPADRAAASKPALEPKPDPKPATKPEPIRIQPTPGPPVTVPVVESKPVKTVRVTVDSTPAGATVTIGGEKKGTTPYVGELDRRDTPVEINLTLAGYVSVTKKVDPEDDVTLLLLLEKKRRPAPGSAPGPTQVNTRGTDDTKNPFDRFEKKGQP